MDALPEVPDVGPWPDENVNPDGTPAGTYTLTKEYTQKVALFFNILVNYTLEQYAKCGPVDKAPTN